MMCDSYKLSYIVPRDPSIKSWSDRIQLRAHVRQNLVRLGMDESIENSFEKLKVYLRIKPYPVEVNPYKIFKNTIEAVQPKHSAAYKGALKNVSQLIHKFHFSSIFNEDASQESIFNKCVLENLKSFLNGENDLLFVYGTSNAGKTFTMQGTAEKPGMIPRALQFVFNSLKGKIETCSRYQPFKYNDLIYMNDKKYESEMLHKDSILSQDFTRHERQPDCKYRNNRTETTVGSSGFSYNYENATFREMESNLSGDLKYDIEHECYGVWISMIEIYKEQVYDLLQIAEDNENRVRIGFAEDENGKVYMKNLCYVNVSSGHEAYQVYQYGCQKMQFGRTALNDRSSRSHCIFTINLARFVGRGESTCAILSRFSFCDLAGIERVKKALPDGNRLVESKAINTSLSIFVKCLTIIKENQTNKESRMVPYRESKLTRLFKDAMTGKERFSIIVNITPETHLFDETLNVLKFSAIAQKIVPLPNIFHKPKGIRPRRKSKFAAIAKNVTDASVVDWESASVVEVKEEKDNSDRYHDLQRLVDQLKAELSEERLRCKQIEDETRQEVASQFTQIMNEHIQKTNGIFKQQREKMKQMEERYSKKEELLKERFMKKEQERYGQVESEMEKMKKDMEILEMENNSMQETLKEMTEINDTLTAKCAELEFHLAEKVRIIETLERKKEACNETEAELDAKIREMENQLTQSNSNNKELKALLDDGVTEYRQLLQTNQALREENAGLTTELATSSTQLEDLKYKLFECEKLLEIKTRTIEKLETKLEEIEQPMITYEKVIKSEPIDEEEYLMDVPNVKCEEGTTIRAHNETNVEEGKDKDLELLRSDMDAFKLEKDGLSSLCNEQCEEIKLLREELKRLREETVPANDVLQLNGKIELLVSQVTEKEKEIEALTKERDEFRREKEKEIECLKAENDKLVRDLNVLGDISNVKNGNNTYLREKTPDRLNGAIGFEPTILNSETKKTGVDENLHPSLIKARPRTGKKKIMKKYASKLQVEDQRGDFMDESNVDIGDKRQTLNETKDGRKCAKKLFTDNDFEDMGDLQTSFVEELGKPPE